jgi:hypothetical protein
LIWWSEFGVCSDAKPEGFLINGWNILFDGSSCALTSTVRDWVLWIIIKFSEFHFDLIQILYSIIVWFGFSLCISRCRLNSDLRLRAATGL